MEAPDKINQAVIEQTSCDYILFQDADDWSAPSRLPCLMEELIPCEADMVGSQLEMVYEFNSQELELFLPLDPLPWLIENPLSHPLLYSTAILSRNFFLRLGGFSDFRFGAVSEFIRRAINGGNLRNVEDK